ncbi:MAG: hypothetical protein ACOYOS_13560 [Syntrophales bacterium]
MAEKETQQNQAADLRRKAEKIARENAVQSPKDLLAMSHEETLHALHELRVHQFELEMQNEALRRTHVELVASQALYSDRSSRHDGAAAAHSLYGQAARLWGENPINGLLLTTL